MQSVKIGIQNVLVNGRPYCIDYSLTGLVEEGNHAVGREWNLILGSDKVATQQKCTLQPSLIFVFLFEKKVKYDEI